MMLFAMLKKNKISVLIFALWAIALSVFSQDIPSPMQPYRLVNDFAGIFSTTERDALEQKLLAYNDSTSTQIYVVTVNDLGGYPISEYSFRLGESWGIGQKTKNNGAVILIKPKTVDSRGEAFIANGYGLEAYLTDAFTGRIIRDVMIPYFKENNYYGGVDAAADVVIKRLSGQFQDDEEDSQEGGGFSLLRFLLILFIIIFILRLFRGGGGDQHIDRRGNNRGRGGMVFFPPIFGGGGGGFSGGGFGGGFGGGGGGSFGGGGAGGSW